MNTQVNVFLGLFLMGIILLNYIIEYNKKCKEVRELKLINLRLIENCVELRNQLYFWKANPKNKKNEIKISQEIKDAVRLAMKYSHPDNGGTESDFIKYRNLYDKIK